ncbi:hypothetical protein MGYG_07387 [Nannizzia gypsea CBS 118893]|uniref:Secreted protein n=1 Tax=Arthroderma gypseum (strain ATCC MYA-4604 / CBS 118893) TaxID=535722 RepID=E4V305_ARTGP|nr:hypothetical protein MGYG_07387 [Nannizzia gypsea CBS 118893]EFR04379.1 hypothetical protein MGYG_07387 [Nannizzia gypsea CBS 118893]
MRVVSFLLISLLAGLAPAVLFNGSFSIFDDYSGSALTVGTTGPLKGLVEVRPNTIDPWLIETIPGIDSTTGTTAIIRHAATNLYLGFRNIESGETAIFTDEYPAIVQFEPRGNLRFRAELPTSNSLYLRWVVEKFSTLDNRLVLRLRTSSAKPEGRTYFTVLGTPNATLHE